MVINYIGDKTNKLSRTFLLRLQINAYTNKTRIRLKQYL